MKVKLRKPRGNIAAGSVIDLAEPEAMEAIQAKEAWLAITADDNERSENELNRIQTAEVERRKIWAENKINAAITRNVFPASASEKINQWRTKLLGSEGEAWAQTLDEISGKNLTDRVVATQTAEIDPNATPTNRVERPFGGQVATADAIKAYYTRWTEGVKCHEQKSKMGGEDSDALRREAGTIACRELFSIIDKPDGDFSIRAKDLLPIFGNDPIKAANSVGTLAGTLVLQRTLQLLRRKLVFLTKVSTDFSAEGAKINQVIASRTRGIPSTTYYDPPAPQLKGDGTAGAGTGWSDSNATTTDVTVTILAPVGVQIMFDTVLLGSTVRNLFQEQAEGMQYALAVALVKLWVQLFTTANFGHSADIPDSNGPAVPWGTTGVNIGASGTFTAKTLTLIKNGLDAFLNPDMDRLVVLPPNYYNALLQDPALVAYLYAGQIEALTKGVLPELFGFLPYMTQAANDLTSPVEGMAMTPSATLLAARLPQDYSQVFPDMPPTAIVEAVTEPETGLSLQMVRFVDHKLAETRARAAVSFGAAVGQKNAGILLTSS